MDFPGICCKYCYEHSILAGRFFPTTLNGLYDKSLVRSISKHLGEKCTVCPLAIKNQITMITTRPTKEKNKYRKKFATQLWYRIHPELIVPPVEK